MLENSALNARVAFLEEEKSNVGEQLSLKLTEEYDALVRRLLSNCVQLQVSSFTFENQSFEILSVNV